MAQEGMGQKEAAERLVSKEHGEYKKGLWRAGLIMILWSRCLETLYMTAQQLRLSQCEMNHGRGLLSSECEHKEQNSMVHTALFASVYLSICRESY